jgi:hypothetical protein
MPVGGLAFLTKESNNVRRAVEWTLATSVVRSGHIAADDLPPLFLGLQLQPSSKDIWSSAPFHGKFM